MLRRRMTGHVPNAVSAHPRLCSESGRSLQCCPVMSTRVARPARRMETQSRKCNGDAIVSLAERRISREHDQDSFVRSKYGMKAYDRSSQAALKLRTHYECSTACRVVARGGEVAESSVHQRRQENAARASTAGDLRRGRMYTSTTSVCGAGTAEGNGRHTRQLRVRVGRVFNTVQLVSTHTVLENVLAGPRYSLNRRARRV